jgi:hypothetical protein
MYNVKEAMKALFTLRILIPGQKFTTLLSIIS